IIAANGEVRQPKIVMQQTDDVPRVSDQTASPQASPVAASTPGTTGPTEEPTEEPEVERTEPDANIGMSQEALEIVKEGMSRVINGENGTARINGDGSTK